MRRPAMGPPMRPMPMNPITSPMTCPPESRRALAEPSSSYARIQPDNPTIPKISRDGPCAVDRQGHAGDVPSARSAEEHDHRGNAFECDESAGRLADREVVALRILFWNARGGGQTSNAITDRGGWHRARTNRVAGDIRLCRFERHRTRQAVERRLRRDV